VAERPFVLINVAATLDGKIDTFERRGAPISSEADRDRVDRLRAEVDAVMVGGHTLLDEDPRLTVTSPELRAARLARGEPESPAKVGVTSSADLRPDARFLTHGPARIILFVPQRVEQQAHWLRERGVSVFARGAPRVDLQAALGTLAELGMQRVLVEGGATLNFELLRLGLVDEVQVYVAPLVFGGAGAPTLAGGAGLVRSDAIALERLDVRPGDDGGLLLRYAVRRSEP
jgi:2,5-diamino-6-(ribosylamino)-4(3H)-pyrimidinone 5'-phosphate reductase